MSLGFPRDKTIKHFPLYLENLVQKGAHLLILQVDLESEQERE